MGSEQLSDNKVRAYASRRTLFLVMRDPLAQLPAGDGPRRPVDPAAQPILLWPMQATPDPQRLTSTHTVLYYLNTRLMIDTVNPLTTAPPISTITVGPGGWVHSLRAGVEGTRAAVRIAGSRAGPCGESSPSEGGLHGDPAFLIAPGGGGEERSGSTALSRLQATRPPLLYMERSQSVILLSATVLIC